MNDRVSKGYVIRCVDSSNGRVVYRGNKYNRSDVRDTLKLDETYTLKGAKAALVRLNRKKPEDFYSIEMLGCCYPFFEEIQTEESESHVQAEVQTEEENETGRQLKQRIMRRIEHSMKCLDELSCVDRFDDMRINEVKYDLHEVKELLSAERPR